MIDARRAGRRTFEADVCIVGAGAAGLTLATRLVRHVATSPRIVLLEAGGRRPSDGAEGSVDVAGLDPEEVYSLAELRAAGLGGTTHLWGGVLVPLDECDFERRDWVPHSGWPIHSSDLAVGQRVAADLLGAAAAPDELDPLLQTACPSLENWASEVPPEIGLRSIQLSGSPRLAEVLLPALARTGQVEVLHHARATQLLLDRGGRRIEEVAVVSRGRHGVERSRVRAQVFVLATGGVENPRILLSSPGRGNAALGNEEDLVGRYFMEHRYVGAGILRAAPGIDLVPFTEGRAVGASRIFSTLALSSSVRRERRLLDQNVRLFPFSDLDGRSGVRALHRVRDAVVARQLPKAPIRTAATAARDTGAILSHLAWRLSLRHGSDPRPSQSGFVFSGLEQEPDVANRVTLSSRSDPLGVRLPHLRFRLSERHWQSAHDGLALLDSGLRRSGLGRIESPPEVVHDEALRDKFGAHHLGTTRMHADPRQGVVDGDCRVHETDNLFVAGGSVFTTGGSANPTFTLVALAARLADHLLGRYGWTQRGAGE